MKGGGSMSTIKFIHTADLHLDSPFKGMSGLPVEQLNRLRESTFDAFANLIDYALEMKPDFVLIVGDIYDGENRSLRAQMKFKEGMDRLNSVGIPVFISHGNHDHLSGTWTRFELPANVHVFKDEVETVQLQVGEQSVSIYGFSYKERHIREKMIDRYPPAHNRDAYHIGMLHGSLAGDDTHAVYAPFTKSELLAKQYDYWALGHIHLRQHVHDEPPIVYPGNIQGRHRNEQGEKGFYDVELSKTGATFQFIPTSTILFDKVDVSCKGISHANEWLVACMEALETFRTRNGAGIVELKMVDVDQEAAELFSQSPEEEWLDVLRDASSDSEPFIWIQRILFSERTAPSTLAGALPRSVLGLMDSWTTDDWKDVVKDVYQHTRGVKYLDVLTDEDLTDIQAGAAALLATEMVKTE